MKWKTVDRIAFWIFLTMMGLAFVIMVAGLFLTFKVMFP